MRINRLTLVAGVALALLGSVAFAADKKTVAVTSIVEHPALNAARDGVKKALEDAGYKDGDTLTFQFETAQGSPATAAQIAQKYVGEKADVIVGIATPSAQAALAATKDIPIVFTAVTDPVAAQLVKDPAKPEGNVTGVTDATPMPDQLKLIQAIAPSAKKIGFIYNPGEANSVVQLEAMKKATAALGLETLEAPATKSADVGAAAQSLIGKADAIFVPTDNLVVSALEAVITVGTENKIPVFSGDTNGVERGAVASIGVDYFKSGVLAGEMVVRILKGEKPSAIPVAVPSATDLFLNQKTAGPMGVTLPADLVAKAKTVVK
ncbi:ABC transporter substrate-binding protein [Labrys sp. KNU-23]|uniref:ABC transporter substrate-binding protein n=1 Tax=Labrys sp. KNU-23 TaxID=2789216 RepID=UPI0011EF3F31|nr:ABC transporter substrate-binding protein [Labrys sp. KNU-23]QEN89185.1 ABC transporter substrate-binding protein [Labrys sp. KNU-23]